jgi:hypothetical protein
MVPIDPELPLAKLTSQLKKEELFCAHRTTDHQRKNDGQQWHYPIVERGSFQQRQQAVAQGK